MQDPSLLVITGGVACGKSYALRFFLEKLGQYAAVFDADLCVRKLYEQEENLQHLVRRFGSEILDEQGQLNRASLRALVLFDSEQRIWLEEFIHPQVSQAREEFVGSIIAHSSEIRWIFSEIPLWFEKNVAWEADLCCLIGANQEQQLARLQRNRALTLEQAQALINLQLTSEEKALRADVVCWNDGSESAFRSQLELFCSHYFV